jgi:hypothetical protein
LVVSVIVTIRSGYLISWISLKKIIFNVCIYEDFKFEI